MDKLVVTIKPSGPHNEVLISLAKQIKKERGRHVPKYDPLQIKKQKICRKYGIIQLTLRIIIPCNNWYVIVIATDTPRHTTKTTMITQTTLTQNKINQNQT